MKNYFHAAEAREITGVTQRQLDYWDQKGIVRASVDRARGKGVERKYTYTDLVKLRLVKELRDSGLSLQKIQKAVKHLKKRHRNADPLATEMLITDGLTVHRVTDDHAVLEDVLKGGQLAFSVVLIGKLEDKIRSTISLRTAQKATG